MERLRSTQLRSWLLLALAGLVAGVGCAQAPLASSSAGTVLRTNGSVPLSLKLVLDMSGRVVGMTPVGVEAADLLITLRKGKNTTAELLNRSSKHLKLDLRISKDKDDGPAVPTSSCPVLAGLPSVEFWSERIEWLEVANPREISASRIVCE